MAANQPTQMLTVPAGSQTHVSSPAGNFLHLTDFCKGMAIVWVFLIHYHGGWFGWQAVHVFIVLSGFGLAYSCLQKNTDPYGDSRGVRPRSARGLLSASHPATPVGKLGGLAPHARDQRLLWQETLERHADGCPLTFLLAMATTTQDRVFW